MGTVIMAAIVGSVNCRATRVEDILPGKDRIDSVRKQIEMFRSGTLDGEGLSRVSTVQVHMESSMSKFRVCLVCRVDEPSRVALLL